MKRIFAKSIVSVVVIILASLSNVVGYQTIQSTNQNKINNEVNQKELLFQTIIDIANNKEIQQIILKSQINRDGLFYLDEKLSLLNTPTLKKNQIKQLYFIGLLFTKFISNLKMHLIIRKYQFNYQKIHKDISAIIEKDANLHMEVTQLSNLKCDCDNEKTPFQDLPILCSVLYNLIQIIDNIFRIFAGLAVWAFYHFLLRIVIIFSTIYYLGYFIELSLFYLGEILNCWPSNL